MVRLAVLFAGLAVMIPIPSAAGAVRSEFFGVVTYTLDDTDIRGMSDAHVRTNRYLLKWGWVQPTSGSSFNWDPTDRSIGRLAARGIRLVPTLWGNPDWVAGSPSTPPIGGPAGEQAWRTFLKAVVHRYGPGGSYWSTEYRQQFGNAAPLPIQSWQIWNEPNLSKYFAPEPSPGKYARLLQISQTAIKSLAPQARIVLAGMPGYGDVKAWDFLKSFYQIAGIKNYFDAVALHPYGADLSHVRFQIQNVRNVMTNAGDATTPLWLTELAWGSAPDDGGLNKGPLNQAQMLTSSYKMILNNRKAWNVERLFWYQWRDPLNAVASCTFCATAGLLNHDRTTKPAFGAFRNIVSETTPPTATITGGPSGGSFIKDPTPSFSFTSNEAGSTFVCRGDAGAFKPCSSPYTTPPLANGSHLFFVRAIDAPGNESQIIYRYFHVDTQAPPAPRITDTDPNSPANDNAPEVKGSAEAASTVRLFKTAGCTAGTAVAVGSAAKFASPGITASVPDNTTTAFRARATDRAGNLSPCSAAFNYVEDSTP